MSTLAVLNSSEPLPILLIYAFHLPAVNIHKAWRILLFPQENIFSCIWLCRALFRRWVMKRRIIKAGGSFKRCTTACRDERWTHGHVALQETASHCKTSKLQKYYRNRSLLKQSFVEIPCPSGRKGVSFNEFRGSHLPAGQYPWREQGMESHTPWNEEVRNPNPTTHGPSWLYKGLCCFGCEGEKPGQTCFLLQTAFRMVS